MIVLVALGGAALGLAAGLTLHDVIFSRPTWGCLTCGAASETLEEHVTRRHAGRKGGARVSS